ncbi:MAG: amino acid ABC transporter permease [Azospirillaceae bacterium]|nr:amino acid ABC transporter permease [Azospirillaceae bacterium]
MTVDPFTAVSRTAPPRGGWAGDPRYRALALQAIAVAVIVFVAWYLISNTIANLARANVASGYAYLGREASFGISETLIDYAPNDSYGRAILVGLLNTLKVSVVGIVLATLLGTLVGIARLSSNWLLSHVAEAYVELIRNIPLLLQLLFWYTVITETLPGPRQAFRPLPGVFLSNRGLAFPVPNADPAWSLAAAGLLLAFVGCFGVRAWARRRLAQTGRPVGILLPCLGILVGLPALAWLIGGAPTGINMPQMQGFNLVGGVVCTPEFTAILAGLVVYTAAFIAEIVRSGILAVSHGQTEAATALGLTRGQILRLITLPQALRLIIPPVTSQYLNLAKNSSLAVAIGYPDLVSVLNTTMNQTGQAVENVVLFMSVYLTISLAIAAFMNWYNAHIALVER